MKNVAWKLVPTPFYFSKNIFKKESEEVCMLIRRNSDRFGTTYLIKVARLKNLIFQ